MNFIAQAFSERGGKPSSHRILTTLVVVNVMVCWTAVVFHKWELVPMDPTSATIVLGALGVAAWKRGKENDLQKETKETKTEPTKQEPK